MRALALLLCLLSAQAWGACGSECWVDLTGTGTGAATGTSASNQCAGTADADCTPVAGTTSTVYYCGQRTTALTLTVGGTTAVPLTYNFKSGDAACGDASIVIASGAALTLNSTITNSGVRATTLYYPTLRSSSGAALFISGADDVLIDHASITNNGSTSGAVTCSASTLSTNIDFQYPTITGSAANGIHCLPTGASLAWNDWTIEYGTITDNIGYGIRLTQESTGFTTSSWNRIKIRYNTISRNGTTVATPAGAVFVRNCDSAMTSDTCASDGNRGVGIEVAYNTVEDNGYRTGVDPNGSASLNINGFKNARIHHNTLRRNTVSGGSISSLKNTASWIHDNDIHTTYSANGIDGAGIYVDRYTDSTDVFSNFIEDCALADDVHSEGAGVALFRATNNKVFGNIIRDCRMGVFWGGTVTASNHFSNNDIADCPNNTSFNGAGIFETAGEAVSSPAAAVLAYNNSVTGCYYGITGSDDLTAYGNNNYFGVTTARNGQTTGAGTDTANSPDYFGGVSPTTADDFCRGADSLILAAGTYLGAWATGYAGHDLGKPPAIGARGLCNARRAVASRRAISGSRAP